MNGLLICTGEGKKKNIGDYIQSVAQEQFFKHTDCYVEREHLDTFQAKEKVNVIMNAWFMWHPENFPPSSCINPLFISTHIVPEISERFMTDETIAYLKTYAPIGARDTGTKELLEQYGIQSYFSGCLTLTLGIKYKSEVKSDEIIFVDPYFEFGWHDENSLFFKLLNSTYYILRYYNKANLISKVFANEQRNTLVYKFSKKLDKLMKCAYFYHSYSKLFDDDVLLKATFISHSVFQDKFKNDNEKMEYARNLLKRYSMAKLVVTSRIHCALPCLGIETPAIFVNSQSLDCGVKRSGGRFGGLLELLHVVYWKPDGFVIGSGDIASLIKKAKNSKLNHDIQLKNKDDYKKISDNLINKVNAWLK